MKLGHPHLRSARWCRPWPVSSRSRPWTWLPSALRSSLLTPTALDRWAAYEGAAAFGELLTRAMQELVDQARSLGRTARRPSRWKPSSCAVVGGDAADDGLPGVPGPDQRHTEPGRRRGPGPRLVQLGPSSRRTVHRPRPVLPLVPPIGRRTPGQLDPGRLPAHPPPSQAMRAPPEGARSDHAGGHVPGAAHQADGRADLPSPRDSTTTGVPVGPARRLPGGAAGGERLVVFDGVEQCASAAPKQVVRRQPGVILLQQ